MLPLTITPLITDVNNVLFKTYLKDISKIPLLTAEEEKDILCKVQQGDKKALEKLIIANLRFVISVAKRYQGLGLEITDLVQAGNLGLIEAANTYDICNEVKFISYAVWYIRAAITIALSNDTKIVHLPYTYVVTQRKIYKLLHSKVSTEELESSKELYNISNTLAEDALSSLSNFLPIDKIENTEQSINEDNDIEEHMATAEKHSVIDGVLNELLDKEHDIIRLYFGIGVTRISITNIASLFGCSISLIIQFIKKTINKIRDNYSEKLKEIL